VAGKIYILGFNGTYQGNRFNAKAAWERIVELLESDDLTIAYVDREKDPEHYQDATGNYQNFNNLTKEYGKLIVYVRVPTEEPQQVDIVTVWLGERNEG